HETRPEARYSDWSIVDDEPLTVPLLPKPTILPLDVVVLNHVSTDMLSSEYSWCAVTMRPLLVPLKRDAVLGPPAMGPAPPRVTPEPAVPLTTLNVPLVWVVLATGPLVFTTAVPLASPSRKCRVGVSA